jgi:single-stranded-DNA-specific exonuclease
MPSGPDGFVADPRYGQEFEKARALLLAHPKRWRVIYHYDGDGVASASSLLRALNRLGYAWQATPIIGVERERISQMLQATHGPVMIVDTGASWLDLFPKHPHPLICLDHHKYPGVPDPPPLPPHVAFVNPLDWGVDGMSEMCAAMLTWLFTIFLDPINWDNAPWGLSGAINDRQHVGGFQGLSARLVSEAAQRSLVVPRSGLALFGTTLGEALTDSIDPFIPGLSGRRAAVDTLLRELVLDPESPVASVTPEVQARLVEVLKLRMRNAGIQPEFIAVLDQQRWYLPSWGMDAEALSNLQNASGRAKIPGVGVALALGDRSAFERAEAAERAWRQGILKGLRRIEDDGVRSMHALRWFESPETTLAGTQAGLAINYILPPDLPVFVFSDHGPDPIKLSGRGTLRMVDRGLDLAVVCRTAAAAVHGEGGGHRVAAGATIPAGTRPQFLEAADRLLLEQLHGAKGFQ